MTIQYRSNQPTTQERKIKDELSNQIGKNRNASEQRTITATLARFMLQDVAATCLPNERVSWCMKRIIPLKETVEIVKFSGGKRATYRNLQTCGSIWHCPVCSSRITDQRRHELSHALSHWTGTMVMATYTLAHNRKMSLTDVLASVKDAYQRIKSGRQYQALRRNFWIAGSVRAVEVTHGNNGWHVHTHELMFIEKMDNRSHPVPLSEDQVSKLQNAIFGHWRKALKRSGKTASSTYGVDVRSAESDIANYIAKYGHEPIESAWDITHELTKLPVKRAGGDNRTPLELLAQFAEGDVKSGNLWIEYAKTFKGTKQLVWSTDIRKRLKLEAEKSDQQASEDIPPEFIPFVEITRRDWIAIRGLKKRGELLQFSSEHTAEETLDYIAEMSFMWWGE